jgi:hypothetical protein
MQSVVEGANTETLPSWCLYGMVRVQLRLPPADAEEDTAATEEPETTDEAHQSHTSGRPQKGLEKLLRTLSGIGLHAC